MSAQTSPHLAYDELSDPHTMATDARGALANHPLARAAAAIQQPPPSILYSDFPREIPKRDITVDDATARLAAAVFPVLD